MYDAIMHERDQVHYHAYMRRTMVYLTDLSHLHVFRPYFKLNVGNLVHYMINIGHPHSDLFLCCPSVHCFIRYDLPTGWHVIF